MSAVNKLVNKVVVTNTNGLHARPAFLFVNLCTTFTSEILLTVDGRTSNGKHILDVMSLGAAKDTEILLEITGEDAEAAMQALVALVNGGFEEE